MQKFAIKLYLLSVLVLIVLTTSAGQTIPPELYSGLEWRLIGPFRGGRVVAVGGFPGSSTTFYFGSVGGGVWETTDAGVLWKPIFDGQPTAAIGALAGHLFHHAGTGAAAGAGAGGATGALTSHPAPVKVSAETVLQFRLTKGIPTGS